jgi:hypothetical protein
MSKVTKQQQQNRFLSNAQAHEAYDSYRHSETLLGYRPASFADWIKTFQRKARQFKTIKT